MDPLAVLMSKAWTTPVEDSVIEKTYKAVLNTALSSNPDICYIPWIDDDAETCTFIKYWFGEQQIRDLRCLAHAIYTHASSNISHSETTALNLVKVALSRIIITKEQCASLARDTSHSRPHRVSLTSNYNVFNGLDKSLKIIRKRILSAPPMGGTNVNIGDARNIPLENSSIDAVLTSPPYLNAIDYMRGHRMSLVWLGYKISELRSIRSNSIGAERAPDTPANLKTLMSAFGAIEQLPTRYQSMISRYAKDIYSMTSEISRVLKPAAKATFVMGNSCLKGVNINNSLAVQTAAEQAGLKLLEVFERPLPTNSRYLPIDSGSSLEKRMRVETIFTVVK